LKKPYGISGLQYNRTLRQRKIMKKLDRTVPRILLVLSVLSINLVLDRVTKYFAVEFLRGKDQISLFWNSIVLEYAENTGAFLSLGNNWPVSIKIITFLIVPLLFCVLAIIYCLVKETDPIRNILITTIASGGIANLYDRIFNSFHVIDFLNFGIGAVRTGILNIADMSVTFGVIFLIFYEYRLYSYVIKNKKTNNLEY